MGGIGRCCCAQCECLPVEDLPTVTIGGYTGGGWAGTCCYEQTFTPNTTPAWVKNCSGLLYEGSVSEQCVTDHYIQYGPEYRGYEFFPGGCDEIPEDYCCLGDSEKIATTTTNWAFTDNAFMALWRRVKEIKVRISREDVDCEGVPGQSSGCKIVIRSRIVYEWKSKIYKNELSSVDQSVTLLNEICFEVDDRYVFDINAPSAFTCSNVPAEPPEVSLGACVYEGTFYFDRVRYFADMPIGDVEFTNANIPGCDAAACTYEPYNYAASVCVFSPSGPVDTMNCQFAPPCYCTSSIQTRDIVSTADDTICQPDSVTEVGNCNGPGLCVTFVTICGIPGDPPIFTYDCNDGVTVERLGYIVDCGLDAINGRIGIGNDGDLGGFYIDDQSVIRYDGCGGCTSASCYPLNEQQTEQVFPYARLFDCSESPCDQSCCWYFDDCPNCFPDGKCVEKYERPYSTVVTHTRTQSCSGLSSESICTSAPSWTITLA